MQWIASLKTVKCVKMERQWRSGAVRDSAVAAVVRMMDVRVVGYNETRASLPLGLTRTERRVKMRCFVGAGRNTCAMKTTTSTAAERVLVTASSLRVVCSHYCRYLRRHRRRRHRPCICSNPSRSSSNSNNNGNLE